MDKSLHTRAYERTHHIVRRLREQPLEVRRQIVVFMTSILMLALIFFWVGTLKKRFTTEASNTVSPSLVNVVQDSVTKIYSAQKNSSDTSTQTANPFTTQ